MICKVACSLGVPTAASSSAVAGVPAHVAVRDAHVASAVAVDSAVTDVIACQWHFLGTVVISAVVDVPAVSGAPLLVTSLLLSAFPDAPVLSSASGGPSALDVSYCC